MGIPAFPKCVGAPGAAYENTDETKGVVDIPKEAYKRWSFDKTGTAQLELAMVAWGFLQSAAELKGSRGFWFIDNTAALMAAVKGRSNQPDLDRLTAMIQLCCFVWNIWPYFEWVESDSNWTDGISREGHGDTWHGTHNFVASDSQFCSELAELPPSILINIFKYIRSILMYLILNFTASEK